MDAHRKWDLRQMRSLPLEAKIIMTSRRIKRWYNYWDGEVYLCFSGGKKSIVLKHLIDDIFDDVPSVFINKNLEYPKIIKDIFRDKYKYFNSDISIFPSRYLYQKMTGRKPYIAKMIKEETMLEKRWLKNGCNEFKLRNGKSMPLSFWDKRDIDEYTKTKIIYKVE